MRKKGKENEAIEEMSAVSPLDFVKPVFSATRFRFLPNELRKRSTASFKVARVKVCFEANTGSIRALFVSLPERLSLL